MQHLSSGVKNSLGLLGLGLLALMLIFFFQAQKEQSGSGTFQSPVLAATASSTSKATPQPHLPTAGPLDEQRRKTPPSSLPLPSVTPIPISKTTDLAPELREADKSKVYVKRANGTFEVFWIRPRDKASIVIPLQPGDVILHVISPASLMGHQPPVLNSPLPTPTTGKP